MALAHLHYNSPALNKQCAMFVTVAEQGDEPRPVVYMLHGLSDDYTIWQRRTSIERYAERYGVLVAMLDGGRSFYCDWPGAGGKWEQHILDSIAFVDRTFHTIANGDGRGIGGLSMGGYGAMKIGLKYPDRFASIVSHSGCLDVAGDRALRDIPEVDQLFPKRVPPGDDCFALAKRWKARRGAKPALRFDCGVDDFLIGQNRRFHAHLERIGVVHQYDEYPGAHSWEYWDQHVDTALQFHRRFFDLRLRRRSLGR